METTGLAREVSFLELLEEATAIYIRVEIDEPTSEETMNLWRSQIEDEAKKIFAEAFGLEYEQIELEVELWEGSLWAKIKAKLPTLLLILNLFNAGHTAVGNISNDYETIANNLRPAVEKITNGTDASSSGFWKEVSTRDK